MFLKHEQGQNGLGSEDCPQKRASCKEHRMDYCCALWIPVDINWYNVMPKLNANSRAPIIRAPSNSGLGCGTVPVSIAVRYAAHMLIPTRPTSIGFSVRSHKIPTASAQKITSESPPNMESKGSSIVLSGSVAQGHVPNSKHCGCCSCANTMLSTSPPTKRTAIVSRSNRVIICLLVACLLFEI